MLSGGRRKEHDVSSADIEKDHLESSYSESLEITDQDASLYSSDSQNDSQTEGNNKDPTDLQQ